MEEQRLASLRAALEERRAEIDQDLDSMAREIQSIGQEQGNEHGGIGNHMAEDGSNMMEAERLTTIIEDLQALVAQIDRAIEKMDDGTFGICEGCGQPIGEERLEAFTHVALCIHCQAGAEHDRALRGAG